MNNHDTAQNVQNTAQNGNFLIKTMYLSITFQLFPPAQKYKYGLNSFI